MSSYQPISLAELREKFKTAREYMDNKIIPIDLVSDFADLVAYFEEDPVERLYSQPDYKKFFFEEFVGGINKRISQIKQIEDEVSDFGGVNQLQYLHLIEKLVLKMCHLFVKEIDRDNSDMADAMRYLLDIQCNLHQNLFQSKETALAFSDASLIDKMSEEEKEWRKNLKVGSKVDAIKADREYNLKMWAKGEVVEVNGDVLQVMFENDVPSQSSRYFHWYSPEIDKYNTQTQGDEWRLDLKPGDFIDGFDSTKVWYQSTVQAREVRIEEEKEVHYIRVGFRIHHPEGNKEDNENRKYFGWSEKFDEWIPAYNPRIQQFQTFAKVVDDAQQNQSHSRYEETIDDQMDELLYSSVPRYAVVRRTCKSTLLVSFLNRFGELGGYQKLIEKIGQETNESLGLETVYYYLDCLSKSTSMFNKVFITEYLPKLEEVVKRKILNASDLQLRNVKKDRIDGIVSCLIGTLQSRIKTYKQREQDKNIFYLDIGCLFLKQNFLERRIDGTKIIQEVCKHTGLTTYISIADSTHNKFTKQQEMQFISRIIQTIKEKEVLYQIFSKERGHFQLVQRSEELLKLLISQNELTIEEMEYVWNSTKIDETTKLELYKVFNEISSMLKEQQVSFIIRQIDQMPLSKVVIEELELVHELSKRARNTDQQHGNQALEFLWKIAMNNQENVDKSMVNHAALAFTDIIKNRSNEDKLTYIDRIIANLRYVKFNSYSFYQNKEGFLSIKMLSRLLKDFVSCNVQQNDEQNFQDPENAQMLDEVNIQQQPQQDSDQNTTNNKFANKSAFIESIESEFSFLEAFFQNFTHYMFKARSALRKKTEMDPNIDRKTLNDKVLADKFIHSDQISERLEFLKQITSESSIKLNKDQVSMLWDELVVHAMFSQDADMFYRWLKDICDSHNKGESIVDLTDLIQFFKEKICQDPEAFQTITVEGFNCIQSFFILINESSKKLVKLGWSDNITGQPQVKKFTSYSNTTGQEFKSYSFNQNKQNQSNSDEDIEIHILVNPNELENIETIWNIVIDSNNFQVTEKASAFLIKLYTSVTYRLEHLISQFEQDFIQHCIENINRLKEVIDSRIEQPKEEFERVDKPILAFSTLTNSVLQRVLPPEERKIKKYLQLIKDLIKNSEKDGTLGVRSHESLFKGEFLGSIQVTNSLRTGSKYQNKFEIGLYSNTTLWELRKIIGEMASRVYTSSDINGPYYQDTPCHPSLIRLYRYTGCTDLKDYENGRTLAELRFKDNEQLTAFKRNVYQSPRVPLVNEHGSDMSEKAKDIFTEWFNMFSVEDPDNPGRRVMTPATCVEFTKSCTDDNCNEEDSRVVGLFAMYDKDSDKKLQLEEFLQFYRDCVFEKEDVVRQNLLAHNYRYDLKKQPIDGNDENIMQIRKSKVLMPRYLVADNHFFFESIFALLNQENEIASSAWNLIKMATTNPTLYQRILVLDKDPEFQWNRIFDSSSIYKMLYALQIVESLLEENRINTIAQNDTNNENQENEECTLKKDWIERFLSLGGFQEILNLFQKSLSLLSQKQVDSLSRFEKNFLEYMLKLIRIFILSAFSSNDQSLYDVLKSVKKSKRSKDEELKENEQQDKEKKDHEQLEESSAQNDKFTTPAKQFKPNVDVIKNQKLKDGLSQNFQITMDYLFVEESEIQHHEKQQEQQTEKDQGTTSTQQRKLENENERFADLASIMKETGLGEVVIEKIDFKVLQNEVLEVVYLILQKKDITTEDVNIVENCLNLWIASLIKNDNLIDEFFKFERSEEKAGQQGIRNAEDFILSGIYTYKSYRVREEFCNTITCIAQKVKNNSEKLPLVYFMDILNRNFPREDQYYATRECKQYFDLFISLIEEFINISTESKENANILTSVVDPFEILRQAIEKLKKHETKEKKGSILEDKTLIGYFNLVEKLLSHLQGVDKDRLQQVIEETNIIHELFYEHLFYNPSISKSKVEGKSKTKESRAACYSLFQRILEILEPRELADFMEDNLWPLLKDLERPKKWKYVPSENSKSSNYVGLVNLGCICYMLSMLQQFFMVPQFRYHLLKAEDDTPEDIKEYKGRQIDDNLLRQMQKMYGFLELSEKQAYDPFEFCFAFKDFDGNPTNTAIQKDAQEFLTIFFDRLEEKLKPTSQKHLLEGVFGGKVCSQLICQSCGNIRNILEKFYNLSLPVKDRKGMEDSLSKMIEGFIINDYKCEACEQKVDVFKRNLIAETPNVLIVHLERIIFNFDTFQNDKINTRFEFPNILNLKDYSFKEVMKKEGRPEESMEQEHIKHLMTMDDEEFIYKLVGVIIHRGTAEHGHYYSLINTKRGSEELDETKPEWLQTEKDPWKEFNDETVKYFSFNELKVEAFGGNSANTDMADSEMSAYLLQSGATNSYGQNAYMLVYDRMKKKPLIELQTIDKENVIETTSNNDAASSTNDTENMQAALECANTATSRVVQEQETKEVLIPYRKVEPFVPEWIKKLVNQDNNSFILDRHIYHESFFNMLKNLFKHIANKILLGQHHYKLDYVPHFTRLKKVTMDIAYKSMFDLLSYYYYNIQMNDMTTSIQSIIQFCDSHYTMSKNQDSILLDFIQKAYLEDDCRHFFAIMFECGDKTSRYYIGKLTSFVINKIYQIYNDAENKEAPKLQELKEAADYILKKFVNTLKTSECQKSWSKFEQYLKMIHDIGCGGNYQVHFLLTQFDIVVDLIDFMLGNRSPLARQRGEKRPVMGQNGMISAFEPLVSLVCFLARFSMTPAMVKEQHKWNAVDNLPPPTLLGYNILTDQGKPEKYPINERAVKFIVYSGFLEQTLREGLECDELGKLLAHYCYQDEQLSKSLCKVLLNGISRNDFEKVRNYLDVVTQLALIKDNYQKKRLEWIFGFGSLISHTTGVSKDDEEVKTKVGVKVLQSFNDEVYTFRSALIYDSIDDALLHLLWRYKGRMDAYTVNCLYSLLNLIAQDDGVAEYFSQIPSPTYLYARYTDWIKPYLNEQLIDARKGYAGSFSAQKEEVVVKALSLYEKYEEFLFRKYGIKSESPIQTQIKTDKEQDETPSKGNLELENEENVKNLISSVENEKPRHVEHPSKDHQNVIKCVPQPYIIVDCVGEKPVMCNNFDGVILTISQLSCLYTMSNPTGSANLSFPMNLFKHRAVYGYPKKKTNNSQQSQEQQLQAQCIQNYFQSSNFGLQHRPKNQNNKEKQVHEQENSSDSENKNEPKVFEDDDKQWDMINNMNVSDIDDNDVGYLQDQENDGSEDRPRRQNSGIDQGLEPDMEDGIHQEQVNTYKIRVIEEGEIVETKNFKDDNNSEQLQNDGNNNVMVDVDTNNEDQDIIQWPNEVKLCEDLVYKISVENTRESPVKVSLIFNESNPDNPSNLFYPEGGMKAMVYSNQTKTILLLHKLVPDQVASTGEIHKLAIELYWKEKNRYQGNTGGQQSYFSEYCNIPSTNQSNANTQLQAIEENDDVVNEPQDPKINVSDSNIVPQDDDNDYGFNESSGMKQCPQCTLFNDPGNIQCEVCEFSLL